ncbi:hypothetical protein VUR80DRAFT_4903 [Thermomyces stellatus]
MGSRFLRDSMSESVWNWRCKIPHQRKAPTALFEEIQSFDSDNVPRSTRRQKSEILTMSECVAKPVEENAVAA